MAMSLCVRALRLTRAARPLLQGRASCLARLSHTAPAAPHGSSFVTGHEQLGPQEEEEEEVHNMFLKNPDSYGFLEDPEADWWNAHLVFFFSVTLCLVFGTIFVYYLPDPKGTEWARKEAERLIKLRESQGLPLITADYYDPSTLVLPDDDEE